MNEARTISVSIKAPAAATYALIADPRNLPTWSFFILAVEKDGDVWRVQTQAGDAQMRFVDLNDFGIVDHWVRVAGGADEIYVPLRVITNAEGCEVLFTIFRQPGMEDAAYEHDIALVRKDLARLKSVMEAATA